MHALYQKNLLEQDFPFSLTITEGNFSFPHHWHEQIEIVYVMEGRLKVGINNKLYNLGDSDILLISGGDIHCFISQPFWSKTIVIQFGLSIFDNASSAISDRRFVKTIFDKSCRMSSSWESRVHKLMKNQIEIMIKEYTFKEEGYKMALKARLYDLVLIVLRNVPMDEFIILEKNTKLLKLKRLETIFQYVEDNYERKIQLKEIAQVCNFSIYHFTRFFKECTGMTFIQYLNNFCISKAEWYLINLDYSISEIAYKSGFNSIKTFNRVFKQCKGCSPSEYKRAINEN